jgi:hypothetical protein
MVILLLVSIKAEHLVLVIEDLRTFVVPVPTTISYTLEAEKLDGILFQDQRSHLRPDRDLLKIG